MEEEKRSLQYRRTHRAIVQAFLALMKQKSYEKITVQNILDEALVSRNTFYLHFKDKQDIVESLYHKLLADLQSLKETYFRGNKPLFDLQGFVGSAGFTGEVHEFMKKNQGVISALSKIHVDGMEMDSFFKEDAREYYLSHPCNQKKPRNTLELEAAIYGAMIGAFASYRNYCCPEQIDVDQNMWARGRCFLFSIGVRDVDEQNRLLSTLFSSLKRSFHP